MVVAETPRLAGMVVALQANFLEVELEIPNQVSLVGLTGLTDVRRSRLLCTRRTRLDHRGAAIHVGDRVWLEAIDWQQCRAVVADVEPRQSWLNRPPVANVTAVVVALAVKQPCFDSDQASRFLLNAEQTGLAVHLILTKRDLITSDQLEQQLVRLRAWGYRPMAVSVQSGEGLDSLQDQLSSNRLAVLCGPSGVGKTSLLNKLLPQASLRVAAVSGRLQRGRHTTRHVELYRLCEGSLVADTPGFNRPELPGDPRNLALLFPELRRQLETRPCRFRDCFHRDEPGCEVDKSWERYPIYKRCLKEMERLSRSSRGGSGLDRQ
ncbi:MAG: ribosome small subunit-dependent GTPase A [Prochlorococcus sp.]|mgnify:CR=1 FL=1|nr:ribosome small subunit-dependent GTPase A [Prochlorococcaceae cyanobacterium ETNP18_MAG_14]MDP6309417.1 ribosome small subunit-dependent GTPase A [Prochlorococcaceae cyanobacterium ETNP14_MAG_4]HJM81105.1 ribosome small subunit-dependent GTPase A [Prochlorococcaceae cyanobacterium Fu_MAG_72]